MYVVIWQMQKFMFHCTAFAFFFFNLMAISEYKTQGLVFGGAIYWRVFCITNLGGVLVFGGAYTWRGLFSEFCSSYGKISNSLNTTAPNVERLARFKKSTLSRLKSGKGKQ